MLAFIYLWVMVLGCKHVSKYIYIFHVFPVLVLIFLTFGSLFEVHIKIFSYNFDKAWIWSSFPSFVELLPLFWNLWTLVHLPPELFSYIHLHLLTFGGCAHYTGVHLCILIIISFFQNVSMYFNKDRTKTQWTVEIW